jgi:hypothetical protein
MARRSHVRSITPIRREVPPRPHFDFVQVDFLIRNGFEQEE